MTDTRRKNNNWIVTNSSEESTVSSWDQVQVAVLMDLRDELKLIRQYLSVLGCPNFIDIPNRLTKLVTNTQKPKRRKAKRG